MIMPSADIKIVEEGSFTSPEGFFAAAVTCGLKQSGLPDFAILFSEVPATVAGSFTSCRFAAAPVCYDREILTKRKTVRAVIINSGNANACTGVSGLENARKTAIIAADALALEPDEVLLSSTGRIGVQLPMEKIRNGITVGAATLSRDSGAAAAAAIMTTDTRPKMIAVEFEINGQMVRIGGMSKGAGMIAPDMHPHATMLAYLSTDAELPAEIMRELLAETVPLSFNRITIDGDISTNDTVLLLANGSSGAAPNKSPEGMDRFRRALLFVMQYLAREMVLDGEGVTRFVTVRVDHAASVGDAEKCARKIAESLLCKTAWFGGDPNWGRVLAAAGHADIEFDPARVSLFYDELPVVRNGEDAGTSEAELAAVVGKPEFTVRLDLDNGSESAWIWTNDISYEYVKINADYRT